MMLYIALIAVAIIAASSIVVLGALMMSSRHHGREENFYRITRDTLPKANEKNGSSS